MTVKPARWAVNPGLIAPEWKWAWRGLELMVPFWDDPPYSAWVRGEFGKAEATGTVAKRLQPSGYGAEFDGSGTDYLEVAPSGHLTVGSTEMTVLWVGGVDSVNEGGMITKGQIGIITSTDWFLWSDANTGVLGRTNTVSFGVGGGNNFLWRAEAQSNLLPGRRVVVGRCRTLPKRIDLWVDGVFSNANAAVNNQINQVANNPQRIRFGNDANLSNELDGAVEFAMVWNRFLSDAEVVQLSADPFGPIRPDTSYAREQTWSEATGLRAIPGAGL